VTGVWLNTAAVLAGGVAGLALKSRLPERAQQIALRVLGAVTLALGAHMTARKCNVPVVLTALALGMATGSLLRIQRRLENAAQRLLQKFPARGDSSRIAEGFVATSLLFCVGPMTIIGSIQDGLSGDYRLIAVKAAMDCVAAMAFASTMGWGVLLSAGTVLVVQGGITLGAGRLAGVFTEAMVAQFTPVGGALVICIGLSLTGMKKLPVADYLPAILYAPLLIGLMQV
jgi:hypothetical protein